MPNPISTTAYSTTAMTRFMNGPPSMMMMRFQTGSRKNVRCSSPSGMVSAEAARASCTRVWKKPVEAVRPSASPFAGGYIPAIEM